MKKIILAIVLFAGITTLTYGDVLTQVLKEGAGVRAFSMGSAFTAVAQGPETLLFNPAGLGDVGATYRFEQYDNNGLLHTDYSAHLIAIGPFGVTRIRNQDLNGNTAELTAFGFGKRGNKGIDWGVNVKNVRQLGGPEGWSSDVGILVRFTPNIQFGFTGVDLFQSGLKVSPTARAGIALFTPARDFVLASDISFDQQPSLSYALRFGIDYQISDGLSLRCGWTNHAMTYGIGLRTPFLDMDYGVANHPGSGLVYLLSFKFGDEDRPRPNRYTSISRDCSGIIRPRWLS